MVVTPFACFPFSKTLFLAFDLWMRPPTEADFALPHEARPARPSASLTHGHPPGTRCRRDVVSDRRQPLLQRQEGRAPRSSISTRAGDPQFVRSMGSLLGPAIVPGNRVTALCNGDEIFPAMLEAIRGAKRTICFETFIYWSGEIGREFADALGERARAGVQGPRDAGLGGLRQDGRSALIQAMERAGVEVVRYHPLRWYSLGRINNRTHRKLLVVDGSGGLHRRRGHRGQLAGQRPGSGALAGLPLPAGGSGGGPDAGGVHGQLDGDLRPGAARRGILPASSSPPARTPPRCSGARPTTPARACA